MRFVALEKQLNLFNGYRKQVIVAQQELLLIQEQGKRFLIQASCPHRHWPLLQAPIENQQITCSKHGFAFNLADGLPCNNLAQTADCPALKTYRLDYNDNHIGVWLNDE